MACEIQLAIIQSWEPEWREFGNVEGSTVASEMVAVNPSELNGHELLFERNAAWT